MLNRDGSFLLACQSWSLCERNCEVWRESSFLPAWLVHARARVSFVRGSVLTFLINNPVLMPGFREGEAPHRVTNLYGSAGLLQLTDDALDSVIIANHHCYSIRELCLEMRTWVSILTHKL